MDATPIFMVQEKQRIPWGKEQGGGKKTTHTELHFMPSYKAVWKMVPHNPSSRTPVTLKHHLLKQPSIKPASKILPISRYWQILLCKVFLKLQHLNKQLCA